MSLALFRERIEAGDVDETVRAHLRGCDECRAHYDHLASVKRALGDDGAAEEKERLLKTLPLPRGGEGTRRWALASAAAVLLIVGALLVLRKPQPEVQLRGGGNDTEAAPFSLRVYGKDSPGEKVRLIADFPGSKEASVSIRAELQYFMKPPPRSGEVLLVETRSALKTQTARSQAGDDLVPVGAAFPIGGFGPGDVEVCAVLTSSETQTLADAVKAGATKHCSTLLVSP